MWWIRLRCHCDASGIVQQHTLRLRIRWKEWNKSHICTLTIDWREFIDPQAWHKKWTRFFKYANCWSVLLFLRLEKLMQRWQFLQLNKYTVFQYFAVLHITVNLTLAPTTQSLLMQSWFLNDEETSFNRGLPTFTASVTVSVSQWHIFHSICSPWELEALLSTLILWDRAF